MGYRSEVGIIFKKETSKEFKKFKEKVKSFNIFDDVCETKNDIFFHATYIKWYDDYDEVKHITSFMNNLDAENYKFIRLGEDDNDVECIGYYCGDIDLNYIRKLNFDKPKGQCKDCKHASFFNMRCCKDNEMLEPESTCYECEA